MLSDVISRFSTVAADTAPVGGYTITRYIGAGTWLNGRYTVGAPTSLQADGVIVPNDGKVMIVADEGHNTGEHSEDILIFVTTFRLYTVDPKNGQADRVTVPRPQADGTIVSETYVVKKVEGPYNIDGFGTYKAYIARQTVP